MIMTSSQLIIATLSADPTTSEVIYFVLNGLMVVVVALSILAVSCSVIGRIIKQFEAPPAPAQAPVAGDSQDDEVVAVIAAAVAAVIDRPHRIVHVRGLTPEDAAWALQGRMQHHSSHILPHRDRR